MFIVNKNDVNENDNYTWMSCGGLGVYGNREQQEEEARRHHLAECLGGESGDTTPCSVTPVILHGFVSPESYPHSVHTKQPPPPPGTTIRP